MSNLVSLSEAAALLWTEKHHLVHLIEVGRIRAYRDGSGLFVRKDDLPAIRLLLQE